jgi:hypothetical protein
LREEKADVPEGGVLLCDGGGDIEDPVGGVGLYTEWGEGPGGGDGRRRGQRVLFGGHCDSNRGIQIPKFLHQFTCTKIVLRMGYE